MTKTHRKDPAAVSLGRRGGKARAAKLSSEELRTIGKAAAAVRWGKQKKKPRVRQVTGKRSKDVKRAKRHRDLIAYARRLAQEYAKLKAELKGLNAERLAYLMSNPESRSQLLDALLREIKKWKGRQRGPIVVKKPPRM